MNEKIDNPITKYRKLIILFIILLLAVIAGISNLDNIQDSLHEMFSASFDSVIMLIGLLVLYILVDAKLLQVSVASDLKFFKFLLINLSGSFFSGVTPLYIGSYPSRFYYLNKEKVHTDKVLAGLTVKGLIYQVVVIFIGLMGLLVGGGKLIEQGGYKSVLLIGIIYNLLTVVPLVMISLFPWFSNLLVKIVNKLSLRFNKVNDKKELIINSVNNYYKNTRKIYTDRNYFLSVTFLTIIKQIIFYTMPFVVLNGLRLDISSNYLLIIGIAAIIEIVVAFFPTPGGMGAREAAFIIFYGILYDIPTTINAGLLINSLFSYYSLIILGLIATLYLETKKRKK